MLCGFDLDCSQSSIFRKIIEIERFALRAAILHECQNYLGGGGGLAVSRPPSYNPRRPPPRYI